MIFLVNFHLCPLLLLQTMNKQVQNSIDCIQCQSADQSLIDINFDESVDLVQELKKNGFYQFKQSVKTTAKKPTKSINNNFPINDSEIFIKEKKNIEIEDIGNSQLYFESSKNQRINPIKNKNYDFQSQDIIYKVNPPLSIDAIAEESLTDSKKTQGQSSDCQVQRKNTYIDSQFQIRVKKQHQKIGKNSNCDQNLFSPSFLKKDMIFPEQNISQKCSSGQNSPCLSEQRLGKLNSEFKIKHYQKSEINSNSQADSINSTLVKCKSLMNVTVKEPKKMSLRDYLQISKFTNGRRKNHKAKQKQQKYSNNAEPAHSTLQYRLKSQAIMNVKKIKQILNETLQFIEGIQQNEQKQEKQQMLMFNIQKILKNNILKSCEELKFYISKNSDV